MEFCTNPDFLRVLLFIKIIINIIFTIIPIGIVIMVIIDFSKNVTSSKNEEQKKNLKMALKRIGYGILIFSIPFIISRFIGIIENIFGESLNYNSCLENIENIDYYQTIYDFEEERQKLLHDQEIQKMLAEENEFTNLSSLFDNSSSNSDQSRIGQRYNLSESQLERLAAIAQKEQGTVKGVEAEACLMANRFELFGSKYGNGANGLYDYVFKSGWWGDANKKVDNYLSKNKLRDEIKAVVKNVLVNGDRSALAFYVNEHDCWNCNSNKYCPGGFKGDICRLKNNDDEYTSLEQIKNRSNYKKNETIIYNVYGNANDFYIFYSFPANNSDPFGYTNSALEKFKNLNNNGGK